MSRRVGVVLAGGAGRRLGRSKGELEVGGLSLAQRAANVLAPLCDEVVVSLGPTAQNPTACRAVRDALPEGRGPLAGLAAAWSAEAPGLSVDLLVLACDYPRVEREMLELLVAEATGTDVVLWSDSTGRRHPLVALWRASARPGVEALLASGESPRVGRALDSLRVSCLAPSALRGYAVDALLVNVNTAADLGLITGSSGPS